MSIFGMVLRGLGLGLALDALILATGMGLQTWGEAQAHPAVSWRLQRVEDPLKVEKRRSAKLAKGWTVVLEEGRGEAWRCLVRIDRDDESNPPRVIKKIKRLGRGRPARVMTGTSPQENSLAFPRVTRVRRILTVEATAYDPGPVDATRGFVGTTSLGLRAHHGIVAVDPTVIPYRSWLYVEGYGPALAGDTGGAIKGLRADLCFNSTREARLWGRRKARIYLLDPLGRRDAARVEQALRAASKPKGAGEKTR